jgi:hypothetical protein
MDAVYNYFLKLSISLCCIYLCYASCLQPVLSFGLSGPELVNEIEVKMIIDKPSGNTKVNNTSREKHSNFVCAQDKITALFGYVVYQNLFVTEINGPIRQQAGQ